MPALTDPSLLVMPNIPPPLHGIAPRTVFGQSWWDAERKVAYLKAGYKCQACGVAKDRALFHKWLEAHERYEIEYAKGRMVFVGLVALCHACHNYIHSGRLNMLVEQGEVTPERAQQIRAHGDAILAKHKLKRPTVPKKIAAWTDWRMVYEGREYGPSTPDEESWARGDWKNWRP